MTHQIQVPDDLYIALCSIAESHGRKIGPGRGSGLVSTLREMADIFAPLHSNDADEVWMRFNARIMPALNELMIEATRHHERADIAFSIGKGLSIKRIIE